MHFETELDFDEAANVGEQGAQIVSGYFPQHEADAQLCDEVVGEVVGEPVDEPVDEVVVADEPVDEYVGEIEVEVEVEVEVVVGGLDV